jgi:hypothetical protein
MKNGMGKADLVRDLCAIFRGALEKNSIQIDLESCLSCAARDLALARRRTLVGEILADPGRATYPAPDDLLLLKFSLWGVVHSRGRNCDALDASSTIPRLSLIPDNSGRQTLLLDPPPTTAQIMLFGTAYRFFYLANHRLANDPEETTVHPAHRTLLLMRAAAEVLQELVRGGATAPVAISGSGIPPSRGTPAEIAVKLLEEFDSRTTVEISDGAPDGVADG